MPAPSDMAADPAYQAGKAVALQTDAQRRAYVIGYELGKDVDMGNGEIAVPGNDVLKGYEFQFKLGALDKIEGRPAATTWSKPMPQQETGNTALLITGGVLGLAGVLLLVARRTKNRASGKRWNQV